MTERFTGTFPSTEQFEVHTKFGRPKKLPDGDQVRAQLRGYPVMPWALLVPAAEGFARDVGIDTGDVTTMGRRAGEKGVAGFFRAATGLPVRHHSGYAIDLSAVGNRANFAPAEDTISDIRAADSETQEALAEALARNHTRDQLMGLSRALITEAMRPDRA